MAQKVVIVDYGMGNLLSVFHAFEMVGAEAVVTRDAHEILSADRVVLPGVGAFGDCMTNLRRFGLIEVLNKVRESGRPVLGICLGMQAMAAWSDEGGRHEGLGWFDAGVVRLTPSDTAYRVPHVGWNDIRWRRESPLFAGLPDNPDFYFVHSYAVRCASPGDVEAECDYGGIFTAAVRKENLFATQFHPEKSQDYGLQLLANFLDWKP
ncbi:MAG: imidazole glycerol phosphate synthase subunit HisH [Chthonomonadales bacterium]